jgi:hypothetical protein
MSADILSSEVIYFNWYNSVFKKKPTASTGETEAGGWPVQGQPGLYSETLSQKNSLATWHN